MLRRAFLGLFAASPMALRQRDPEPRTTVVVLGRDFGTISDAEQRALIAKAIRDGTKT